MSMTPKEIDEYIMKCPYFSGKYTIDRKLISGEYTHVGSCDLEWNYNKICPSKKCMCANKMGLGDES